jgi:hypothetical protein
MMPTLSPIEVYRWYDGITPVRKRGRRPAFSWDRSEYREHAKHQSGKEDNQNSAVHIREQERASIEALIHQIWRHFKEDPIEMRRSLSRF